jgi:uroporphyrin-III C-methyltransferase
MHTKPGRVVLTGAGPGDPELLTIKALRAIETADAVLYDRLVSPEILALAPESAELIDAGKRHGEQEEVQNRVLAQMAELARRGRNVVRLKGGDPFVFGRGGEEYLYLKNLGIPVEIIPGISSALAAPAAAGIPVTFRGIATSFAVVAGHCGSGTETEWDRYASVDTLVVLMGVADREHIAASLIRAGRPSDEPAAFIERATTPRQRTVHCTLGEIARGMVEVESPAVLVAGAVASESLRAQAAALTALAAV